MGRRLRLKIAARISDLARLQAIRVGELLRSRGHEVEYAFRASLGDQNQNDPLWKMPEKGVFTEDFLRDLVSGEADMVVHSWKDLPTEARPHTKVVATLPRADARDLFLMRKDRFESSKSSRKLRVLTSSPRRAYNLEGFFRDHLPFELDSVVFENVRGNIATRIKKLFDQDVDGLIVAKAAIDRLLDAPEKEFDGTRKVIVDALAKARFMVLPLSVNPTAAAQGALAIEIKNDRADLEAILREIHCRDTFTAVERERKILASYGGGCHQKIGISVLPRDYGQVVFLRGLTDAGEVLNRTEIESTPPSAVDPSKIFPRKGEEASFFHRRALAKDKWAHVERASALWVARDTAWPEDLSVGADTWIWSAGLATWKKLASRGIWVSGTADGLGERESHGLSAIARATGRKLDWMKLTHSTSSGGSMPVCATYELVPKESVVDLTGRTHFYWMSGTAFDRALELFPGIRDAYHACGPGLTHEHLVARLGRPTIPTFLNLDAFHAALSKGKR